MLKIIVPSRKRPHSVGNLRNLLEDGFYFCIGEDEADEYKAWGLRDEEIILHKSDVVGLGKKRQWILDNVEGDIFFLDDDTTRLWCNVGMRGRTISEPDDIKQVIYNCHQIAEDIGAYAYGFSQAWDTRKFMPQKPFVLNTWVGSAFGIIGRDIRFDTERKTRVDIDFSLKVLAKKRFLFVDNRFAFIIERFNNAGGSASIRTEASDRIDLNVLKERWRGAIGFKKEKGTIAIKISVPRQQLLDIGDS